MKGRMFLQIPSYQNEEWMGCCQIQCNTPLLTTCSFEAGPESNRASLVRLKHYQNLGVKSDLHKMTDIQKQNNESNICDSYCSIGFVFNFPVKRMRSQVKFSN